MSKLSILQSAQCTYLQEVTHKLGVTPFDILDNFSTFSLGDDLTSVTFYAFREKIRPEWIQHAYPIQTMELALRLIDSIKYVKVSTQPNFLRFRFETHVSLPFG